jgi:hypothetical protein
MDDSVRWGASPMGMLSLYSTEFPLFAWPEIFQASLLIRLDFVLKLLNSGFSVQMDGDQEVRGV